MSRHRCHHDFVLFHPEKPELLVLAHNNTFTLPRHTSNESHLDTARLLAHLHEMLPLEAIMLCPAHFWPAEQAKDGEACTLYVLTSRTDGPLP